MRINEPIEGALVPESEVQQACRLQLTILEGAAGLVGRQLLINAQGLVNS